MVIVRFMLIAHRIRHLIKHGTLADARAAWRAAITSIDGSKLHNSVRIYLNLHYPVARCWLELGYIEDARKVLAEVPPAWLRQEPVLRAFEALLTSHEQATRARPGMGPGQPTCGELRACSTVIPTDGIPIHAAPTRGA
jgi:hypothetical protein